MPTDNREGTIFALMNGGEQVFALKIDSDLKLHVICATLGLNLAVAQALTLSNWTALRVQLSSSSCRLLSNYDLLAEQPITSLGVTAATARIGGAAGYFDEFIFRTSLTGTFPDHPLRATLSAKSIGGFGSGSLGDVVINQSQVPCAVCTLTQYLGYDYITVGNVKSGSFGRFAVGDEIMAIDRVTGYYDFAHITSISGNTFYLDTIPNITLTPGETVFVKVLHFNTLTLPAAYTLWGAVKTGVGPSGYVAFRCKGDCTINGKILTSGRGLAREDTDLMTHAQLIDKFLCDTGGGIFITCGGTFTATSTARLGGVADGSGKGGSNNPDSNGGGGGAGYGGGGGNSTTVIAHFEGEVGYGGYNYPDIDSRGTPGKCAPSNGNTTGGDSGTCLILIAKTLCVDEAAISTGGRGGNASTTPTGGGGTGFCYIACERMI